MLCVWAAKGGAGVSVVSAALGMISAKRRQTLLVDLGGDLSAILGLDVSGDRGLATARGVSDWLTSERPPPDALARLELPVIPRLSLLPMGSHTDRAVADVELASMSLLAQILAVEDRTVIVDLGRSSPMREALLGYGGVSVLVTRACYLGLRRAVPFGRPDRVVFVRERGRALRAADVSGAIGAPISVEIDWDPSVARAVDAGLLAARLPRGLHRLADLLNCPQGEPVRLGEGQR